MTTNETPWEKQQALAGLKMVSTVVGTGATIAIGTATVAAVCVAGPLLAPLIVSVGFGSWLGKKIGGRVLIDGLKQQIEDHAATKAKWDALSQQGKETQ